MLFVVCAGHVAVLSGTAAVSAVVPPEPVASSQFTSTAAVAASAPAGTNVAAGGTLTTADLQRAMASFQGLTVSWRPHPHFSHGFLIDFVL